MYNRVKDGEAVVKIQSEQEIKLCKEEYSYPIRSEDCSCATDKACSCACFISKTKSPYTHASVELAQAIEIDRVQGSKRSTYLIQKIADYEGFVPDKVDDDEFVERGRGGKLLLKIFKIENEETITPLKKVLINDNVEHYYHPNTISVFQEKNCIFFYQVFNNEANGTQNVILRCFDLAREEFAIVKDTQIQDMDPNQGKLLSVVFFKQREHKTDSTPVYDKTLPKLPRQPVGFIYQRLEQMKGNFSSLNIDIRDSDNISKVVFEKALEIENFAAQLPMAFYDVDHTENNNQLDIEKHALYFEGHIFYHQYGISDQLEIFDVTNRQSTETLDYINQQKWLMRQEEDSKDEDKGINAGILNYYECRGFNVAHTLQKQTDRIFFKNTIAIFNNLEHGAYVVQQTKPSEISYTITLVNSSIRKPLTKDELVGQNRLFAEMPLQDIKCGFDHSYFQYVVPRHMNFMLSYIYEGHNLKILVDGKTIDVREKINDMQLATHFQTPILKYFYPLESDIVSGNNIEKFEKIIKNKLIFSKEIVHFDGLKLENEQDIKDSMHHKFLDHKDTEVLLCNRENNDPKKDEQAVNASSKSVKNKGDDDLDNLKDPERHLIVTEKVIFTHDDRSVRPILLIKTEGEVFKYSIIQKVTIAMFDFKNMRLAQTQMNAGKKDQVDLRTSINLDLRILSIASSYKQVTSQFKLIPCSEISYKILTKDDKLLKLTQHFQIMVQSTEYHKIQEILEFKITWKNSRENPDPVYADISLIGKKIFMIQKDSDAQKIEIMPLLNEKNEILGSQIIYKDQTGLSLVYELPQGEFKYKNQPYTWSNTNIFQGRHKAYLLEAQLAPLVIRDQKMFNDGEINFLLDDTLKVLGNSIPFDATLTMSRKPYQKNETLGYGFMSALEILYGHPTFTLYLPKPDMMEKALTQCCSSLKKYPFSMSYFERFCEKDDEMKHHLEKVAQLKLNIDDIELSRGVDLRSILDRALELEQTTSLKLLAKHMFDGPRKKNTQLMMMRNFEKMTQAGKIKHMADFVTDSGGDADKQPINLEHTVQNELLEQYVNSDLELFQETLSYPGKDYEDLMLERMIDKDVDLAINGQTKIKHAYIDFQPLIFQRKLDYLLEKDTDQDRSAKGKDMQMNWLKLSEICNDILEQDEDLDSKLIIKNIIDYIFNKYSYHMFVFHNFLYVFGYILPHYIQIGVNAENESGQRIIFGCMILFMCVQCYFFSLELIDMNYDLKDYFSSAWNNIDVPIFFISLVYSVLRLMPQNNKSNFYPFSPSPSIENPIYVIMIILNMVILMLGILKIMFFLRVYDEFGRFVKLLWVSITDMGVFFAFMTFVMVFISVLFTVMGAEFANDDYPGLGLQLYYFLQIFRNSIGDIAPPGYQIWIDYIENQETVENSVQTFQGYVMISFIWLLWFLNIIVACIVLLNFLIAIISQSYEQVNAQQILHKYKHRCEINRECLVISQFFFSDDSSFNSLIIYSQSLEDLDENYEGMITNIRNCIREDGEKTMENISKSTAKVTQVLTDDRKDIVVGIDKIKVEVREKSNQVKDEIKNKINKTNEIFRKGEVEVVKLFQQCETEMNEEFDNLKQMTNTFYDHNAVFRNDMKGFKQEIYTSKDEINDGMKMVSEEIKLIDRNIDRHDIEDLVQDDNQEFFRSKSPYQGFDHNNGERGSGMVNQMSARDDNRMGKLNRHQKHIPKTEPQAESKIPPPPKFMVAMQSQMRSTHQSKCLKDKQWEIAQQKESIQALSASKAGTKYISEIVTIDQLERSQIRNSMRNSKVSKASSKSPRKSPSKTRNGNSKISQQLSKKSSKSKSKSPKKIQNDIQLMRQMSESPTQQFVNNPIPPIRKSIDKQRETWK